MIKETVLYIITLAAAAGLLRYWEKEKEVLPLPHLATSECLLLLSGTAHDHPSLPLYKRVYLLSDSAHVDAHNVTPIRLIRKEQEMTGIIYTYHSIEFAKDSIGKGFLDIANLNRFMSKTLLVPLEE